MFQDIIDFHAKFGLNGPNKPTFLADDELEFRIKALQEEVQEFIDATTLEESIDALVDLAVFTLGTAERMGFNWNAHWNEVMYANMQKELANDASKSKRGYKKDIIKPPGWKSPNHTPIINGE